MDDSPKHIIILPYYCEDEVARYLKIAQQLKAFPQPAGGYHFLLASSPKTRPSYEMMSAFSAIGNAIPFACPSRVFGYPQGPTAMFWDCMEYLTNHYSGQTGFGLWLESDMAPTQPDWIDRLSQEWFGAATPFPKLCPMTTEKATTEKVKPLKGVATNHRSTPIMMGCYVPEVFKQRIFKAKKLILHAHINGGACYSMDFAQHMPKDARKGVFDMAVFKYAQRLGRIRATPQIAFSTINRVRRDLLDTSKVLLHGFMQDKNQFIQQCCEPITDDEKRGATWHDWLDRWENLQRKVKVQFVRRGHRAMLENMFLAKREFDLSQHEHEQLRLKKSA